MNQTAGELETEARSYQVRLPIRKANPLSSRHFFLLPVVFLLSGCLGLGGGGSLASRYGTPKMPAATEVVGSISLSGTGAGSTTAAVALAADASATDASGNGASIGPQLEALTTEIKSLRERFEAMEPAINRLVRVEQDMTHLIAEMELLANDPVPFVAPADLFGFSRQSPGPAAPLSAAGQGDAKLQNPAEADRGEGSAGGSAVKLGDQDVPVLSLGLPDAAGNAGTKSEFAASQPSLPSLPLQLDPRSGAPGDAPGDAQEDAPGDAQRERAVAGVDNAASRALDQAFLQPSTQPGRFGGQAPVTGDETITRSAAVAAGQARQTCDAFGIHVGSYLLQESIASARIYIRERYASVMQGLQYAVEDIDLRDGRGLFHRLIAGPVTSYEQATALCAGMEASGNYCKVTFFNPPECASPYN